MVTKSELKRLEEERQQSLTPASIEGTEGQASVPFTTSPATPEPDPVPTPPPTIIRDQETGDISFLQFPDGRTVSGTERELRNLIALNQKKIGTPAGSVEAIDIKKKERLNELAAKAGNLTAAEKAEIEAGVAERAGSGLLPQDVSIEQAITTGLITGGTAGVAGTIVGTPAVGAVTAATGFVAGVLSSIKSQQKGLVSSKARNARAATSILNNYVSAVNLGMDPTEASVLYEQTVSDTYEAYVELKLQTRGNAKAFDDGTVQLEQFEIFFREAGTLDSINTKFAQAIFNPNPAKAAADGAAANVFSEE